MIKMKNLFRKLASTTTVDGIPVYGRHIMIWDAVDDSYPECFIGTERDRVKCPSKFVFNHKTEKGRLTKRFLTALGIKTKDFKKGKFKDLDKAWYQIDQKKYASNTYDLTKEEIADKLNTFFKDYLPAAPIYPNFNLPHNSGVFTEVGSMLTSGKSWDKILFYNSSNGSYSGLSPDSYFSIDQRGTIVLTSTGFVAGVDKYVRNHDSLNSNNNRAYTVALFSKDLNGDEVISFEQISINTVLDRFKCTVKYNPSNGMLVKGNPQDVNGLISVLNTDKLTYLASLRTDTSAAQWSRIRDEFPGNDLVDPTFKYEAIVQTDFDDYFGHPQEVLALLDDGDAFEVLGYGDYVTDFVDVMAKDPDSPETMQFRVKAFEYSVTLRKTRDITVHDTIVDRIYSIHQAMKKSAAKKDKLSNDTVDTLIKEAILYLIDEEAMDIGQWFYKGYLKVSAVESMTNREFFRLMIGGLKLKYKVKDDESSFDKVVGIVISIVVIIIAVIIFIVVFILTGGNLAAAAFVTQLWLTVAQMAMAKYAPELQTGMKVIGYAAQLNSYILTYAIGGAVALVAELLMDVGYTEMSNKDKFIVQLILSGGNVTMAIDNYIMAEVYFETREYLEEKIPGYGGMVLNALINGDWGAGMKSVLMGLAKQVVTIEIGRIILRQLMRNGGMSFGDFLVMMLYAGIAKSVNVGAIMGEHSLSMQNLWTPISDLKLSDIAGSVVSNLNFTFSIMNVQAAMDANTTEVQASKDQGKKEVDNVDKAYMLYADNTQYDAINILNDNCIKAVNGLNMTYNLLRSS